MATSAVVTSTTYGSTDRRWYLGGEKYGMFAAQIDWALFTSGTHYDAATRIIPSGMTLGIVTVGGKIGPHSGTTDEVQTLTVGGSGLTTFTLTYSGQTTAAIAAAATGATVQAALEALSNIAVGDVTVTGIAGGPWTVTFAGALANTNVAELTATPTGGSGTVTPATTTAGGAQGSSDGREVAVGHLWDDEVVPTDTAQKASVAYVAGHATVQVSLLPANHGLDAAAQADLKTILYKA